MVCTSEQTAWVDLDLLGLKAVLPWVLWESLQIADVSPVKSTRFYHQSVLLPCTHIGIASVRKAISLIALHTDAIPMSRQLDLMLSIQRFGGLPLGLWPGILSSRVILG